ncbi:MAG TPA: TolC family protein [Candidatus Methylacidiphilales bacterium]|jgi:outer membrane protein|nr:TolC family protein [Candidatus Methylacidiphilales bacterium]
MARPPADPRQRLLDVGLKLFANRGYAGTSVQDITDEAQVTKPTLYYYFGNKEGLFQALVDHAMDERLRLMQEAAPPEKPTVDQLTDIIVALTAFARRQPDLLRLTFAVVFAAEGEYPSGFKKNGKIHDSIQFVGAIIQAGHTRGDLNPAFTVHELTQAYFHIIQHSIALAVIESKVRRETKVRLLKPPAGGAFGMAPRRTLELFLRGAANPKRAVANGDGAKSHRKSSVARRVMSTLLALGLSLVTADAQSTNAAPASDTNQPPTADVVPSTNTSPTTEPPPQAGPPSATNSAPVMPDVRPIPLAVRASHPELATISPIAANASNPRALDLQTCFQLTAVRDDSLKISMEDVEIARAQMSQNIAALWPTFTVSNQQQFIHYNGPTTGFSFTSFGTPVGGGSAVPGVTSVTEGQRNYQSQSNVNMNYTIFNGGQNWNNVGASARAIAAKKQTLARDYQTIYQDVAQAFYNVLQFEGDMAVQADLIDALRARVDDLRDRVNLGRSRPSELLQAQTDLANAKVTLESQRGSMNAAKETVAFYTGIPSASMVLRDTQEFPTVQQLDAYLAHSPSRPDVLSQIETMKQSERQLASAIGQYLPTVSAQGNFLASQDPVSNNIDATMTIEVSMPIFDGGLIAGQVHQNHEQVRQNRINIEQLQRTSDQDTRTAYVNFDAAVAQILVLREAATLAAKDFEAQVDDYRRGVVSNLDVLTALQDYQTARIQLHNANMTARLDLINLNVAAGLAATGPGANNQALPASTAPATAH